MAYLPWAERAQIERVKVVEYLLDATRSRGKAAFFRGFGFTVEGWEVFAGALRRHGATYSVSSAVESAWGIRYSVDGPLETPSGRSPLVRTVWLLQKGADVPRLITAYPI